MEPTPEYEPVWPLVIGALNKVAAVGMTLGSTYLLNQTWGPVGGIGGGLAAVITCGTVAILLDIRQCLQERKGA